MYCCDTTNLADELKCRLDALFVNPDVGIEGGLHCLDNQIQVYPRIGNACRAKREFKAKVRNRIR